MKDLENLVEAALLYYGRKKMLDSTPIPLSLEKDNDPRLYTSPLKFPGKLAIDILNNRLFISDSNHNRIVGSLSVSLKQTYTYKLISIHFTCTIIFSLKRMCEHLPNVIQVVVSHS